MKKYLFILSLFLLFGVAACSDDDLVNETAENWTEKDEAQILDSLRCEMLVQQLCFEEKRADGTVVYTPRYGYALYSAAPTIYYVGVDSLPQAQDKWQDITAVLRDSTEERTLTNEIDVLDLHLTYTEGNEGELARIDVDCPLLANVLTSIVFIPMGKWPANAKGSQFLLCSVWKENRTGYYYHCVRKATGQKGILLTFDGGFEQDKFHNNANHHGGDFFVWDKCAHLDAFQELAFCMTTYKSVFLKAQEQMIKNAGGYHNLSENRRYILNNGFLYDNGNRFYYGTFDNVYSWYNKDEKFLCFTLYTYYVVNIARAKLDYNTHKCSSWTDTYGDNQRPKVYYPSHAIYFDYNYQSDGWTCIFKGVDS